MSRQIRQLRTIVGFYIVILILLSSCASNQNAKIRKFESVVGKDIATCLDLSVKLLDSLVVEYYHDHTTDIDTLFSNFTKGVIGDSIDWDRFYNHKLVVKNYQQIAQEKGLTNELFLQYKNSKIDNDSISLSYEYRPKDATAAVSTMNREWKLSDTEIKNTDSLLLAIQKEIQPNMYNKYYKGLEQVSKNNKLIGEYLRKRRQFHGRVKPSLILSGLEDLELDYSDYFYKRILATEIFLLSNNVKYTLQQ